MSETLFSEMRFIRQTTLHLVRDLSERQMGKIPDGFPHNIHWNLGHIYM
ncbi:DinB family protein [Bacillus weihaiensis]|nr:DinB family protein [Bacillus weihaiensis]